MGKISQKVAHWLVGLLFGEEFSNFPRTIIVAMALFAALGAAIVIVIAHFAVKFW